jgi:hypothetical protein
VVSRRSVGLATLVFALVGCRQVLGVEDLGVRDGGSSLDSGSEGGAPNACAGLPTSDGCYSCCAALDGGDVAFFAGELHTCACNTSCSVDCPVYCTPGAPGDSPGCDLCVYLLTFQPGAPCASAASTAAQASPGANAIDQCIQSCKLPTDDECAGLQTLRGCYDCCENKHLGSASLFASGPAQACVCDGGCAADCPSYCPSGGVDTGQCTRCQLDSLTDGGCAATGASQCGGSDCAAMTACMGLCAQTQ